MKPENENTLRFPDDQLLVVANSRAYSTRFVFQGDPADGRKLTIDFANGEIEVIGDWTENAKTFLAHVRKHLK